MGFDFTLWRISIRQRLAKRDEFLMYRFIVPVVVQYIVCEVKDDLSN